ncbi:DUF6069 family protein [Allonocardiopsis opalescens]|uniref:Uncharacterized protein n=1 Tax=Allonocardiopsis opalescens TaxID=1144618 RepID=A0A2T0Q551_9ACTN|nr:DUF6069 family protein [Allonocardiopsis opalescens]PRX98926.1 hypothetical protein CLV72_104506 [Allonocardiopsis opalescens]
MSGTTAPPATAAGRSTTACRAYAVAGATAAGLAVWVLAVPVAGTDLSVHTGAELTHVGPIAVAGAGLVAGAAAWALLAVLERLVRRPRPVWTAIAIAVLALSLLAGPLGATSSAAMGTLISMHLAVAAVLIWKLGRTARSRRPARPAA